MMSVEALADNGALGNAVLPPSGPSSYEARRSNRVDVDLPADGDTWKEHLVVCEGNANRLVIRAFYKNRRSGQRVWDEPPTGASDVVYATPEMRQEAELQLIQFQGAVNNVPPSEAASKGKKKKLFDAFRRKPKNNSSGASPSSDKSTTSVRGFFGRRMKGGRGTKQANPPPENQYNEAVDVDLQRALALSMGQTVSSEFHNTSSAPKQDTEDMQMAQALSMSEADSARVVSSSSSVVEDEMLQRALEASRLEANGVASLPSRETQLLMAAASSDSDMGLELQEKPLPVVKTTTMNDDLLDQKMPAKPSPSKASPSKASPSKASPSKASPSKASPSKASPSKASPSKASPSSKMESVAKSNSLDEFDPYSKESSAVASVPAAAVGPAAKMPIAASAGVNAEGLRKMEAKEDGHLKPGRLFARVISKKNMEDKAGVV